MSDNSIRSSDNRAPVDQRPVRRHHASLVATITESLKVGGVLLEMCGVFAEPTLPSADKTSEEMRQEWRLETLQMLAFGLAGVGDAPPEDDGVGW